VWDQLQRRTSFFNLAGEYVRSFTLPPPGNLYFAEALFGIGALLGVAGVRQPYRNESGPTRRKQLYTAFNLEGDSISTFGTFNDREMYRLVQDRGIQNAVRVFGRTTVVAAHGSSLFVGTNDGYVIDQHELHGGMVRSVRRDLAMPVTEAMYEAEVAARIDALPEQYNDLFRAMPMPDVLPHYSAIKVDIEGNLWVRHYTCLTMPSFEWTVFDTRGRMLGDVSLPERFDIYEIGSDYVLGRHRDEDGVEYVQLLGLRR
jgi:hypothetical protein